MKTELDEQDIKKAIQYWLWMKAGLSVKQDDIILYKDSVMTEKIYADIHPDKHPEKQLKSRHYPRGS